MDLSTLLEGPANLIHRGVTLHFRGGLTKTPLSELFTIETDAHGAIDRRALENSIALAGTPVGVFDADNIAALHRWQRAKIGQLVTPRYDIEAIDTATDIVTLVGSSASALDWPRKGCPVEISVFPGGTLPAAVAAQTLYYVGRPNDATLEEITLHPTEADALAGTNKINFADDGDGDLAIIEQEPIIIEALAANRRITLHNGALITPPPLILSATQTIWGQVGFAAFIRNNRAWNAANSLYTVEKIALEDTIPDKTKIPSQEYSCAFGAAPWDSFKPRGPVTITPTLSLEPVPTDGRGNVGMKISGVQVAASLQPQGFSEAQMLDLLQLQGGTVARGKTKVRGDLVVTGTGVHVTLYNGAPQQLPQTFSATGPRAGELAIVGTKSAANGYYRVATAAP
jgi:hypothetical protein